MSSMIFCLLQVMEPLSRYMSVGSRNSPLIDGLFFELQVMNLSRAIRLFKTSSAFASWVYPSVSIAFRVQLGQAQESHRL